MIKINNNIKDIEMKTARVRRFRDTNYFVGSDGSLWGANGKKISDNNIVNGGYIRNTIYINKKIKAFARHRLVAECFIPNPNNYPIVNHIDGNKTNNCVDNLEWVSNSQNTLHATRVLKKNIGENVCTSKLNEKDVIFILENHIDFGGTMTTKDLADKYLLHETNINKVIVGKTWRHIRPDIKRRKLNKSPRKLTQEVVKYIREVYIPYDKKYGRGSLAKQFDLDKGTVSRIINRKLWTHI